MFKFSVFIHGQEGCNINFQVFITKLNQELGRRGRHSLENFLKENWFKSCLIWFDNALKSNTIRCKKLPYNCFGSKKITFQHLCLLVFASRRVVLYFFDPKQLWVSCICMVLLFKVLSNHSSKHQFLVFHCHTCLMCQLNSYSANKLIRIQCSNIFRGFSHEDWVLNTKTFYFVSLNKITKIFNLVKLCVQVLSKLIKFIYIDLFLYYHHEM